jgi:Chemoreceptor zinc-binding domain
LDFDAAIIAHMRWKIRLLQCIEGHGEELSSTVVARHDACEVGKWLAGEGAQYSTHASHGEAKKAHAAFHDCAAAVVRKLEAGDRPAAARLLEGSGFADASSDTILAITKLKHDVLHKK